MRAGDDNGRMALLGGEAEQAPRTTRFIVGMRMHHHEGMGFPGHRLLVCEPPHPRSGARSHGPATPAAVGHGGACVADGGRSHGGAQHLVAAHQARASTGDTLEATILASWSTLPCCEARGVMMADGATPQPAWLGVAGATPAGPGAPAHSLWRPHAPCYRRCTRSGRSGPPLPPGRRAPPLPRWGRPTRTSPGCHATGNTPAPATHPGPPPPGPAPDRPPPAPPGMRAGAAPRPG